MPSNITIRARNHFVNVDLKTGIRSLSKTDYPKHNYPEFIKNKPCNTFQQCLYESFRLHINPDEMVNYAFELIGCSLAQDVDVTPDVVLFGPDKILYSIMGTVIQKLTGRTGSKSRNKTVFHHVYPATVPQLKAFESVKNTHVIETFDQSCSNIFKYSAAINDELSGIFNRALKGLANVAKRGYIKIPSVIPRNNFFVNLDPIGAFLETNYIITDDERLIISAKELQRHFDSEYPFHPKISRAKFVNELMARGIDVVREQRKPLECIGIIKKIT